MIYALLKWMVRLGTAFYYRELKILYRSNLPEQGPLILISNHPNTLMDAWVVALTTKRPVYFMAKATVFSSKWKLRLFKKLKMIPINRVGEGKTNGVSNRDSFEACYQLLENNGVLLIFPEGTSYQERTLRPFKSGAARIALDVEQKNAGKLGLKVVPIGIHYSQAERFRSKILIQVGEPIEIAPFLSSYTAHSVETTRKITQLFELKLKAVLFTTTNKQQDELVQNIQLAFSSRYSPNYHKGVREEVRQLEEIRRTIDAINLSEPWKIEEITTLTQQLLWESKRLSIKLDFLDRRFRTFLFFRQILSSLFLLLILAPLFIYGVVHNIIQFKLSDILVKKMTKEVEYYAPLAVAFGLLIYPISYFGFVVLLHQFVHLAWYWKLAYYFSLPITGLFAYYFYYYLKHISFKWHYLFMMTSKRNAVLILQSKREELSNLLFGIPRKET